MAQKKRVLFVFLLGIGILGIGASLYLLSPPLPFLNPSHRQPLPPFSIGVVDINNIKATSKVFQNFKETLDNLNAKIHKEVLEREAKLRLEYEELKKREEQNQEPNPATIKQKTELDKKYAALEKTVQSRKEELDQQYTKGLTHIKAALQEIMNDLATTHGLKMILNKSLGEDNQMDQSIVLYCQQGLDLTQEVIQRLDARLLVK